MGLIIIDPGLSTTIQDAGGTGYREWGVPASRAFHPGAAGWPTPSWGIRPIPRGARRCSSAGSTGRNARWPWRWPGALMDARVLRLDGAERDLHVPLSWSLCAGKD